MIISLLGPISSLLSGPMAVYAPPVIYDRYQIIRNKNIKNPDGNGIVLIAKETDLSCVGDQLFCTRGKIAKFFTEKGIRLYWKYSATSGDLKVALNDPTYQSITLVGHSSRDFWHASDKIVHVSDIPVLWNGKQKDGYWLQWGCGEPSGKPLGYDVMKFKDRIFGWKTPLTARTRNNLEQLVDSY